MKYAEEKARSKASTEPNPGELNQRPMPSINIFQNKPSLIYVTKYVYPSGLIFLESRLRTSAFIDLFNDETALLILFRRFLDRG